MATEVSTFVEDLLAETREKEISMLDAAFLHAVEAREVSREQIEAWARPFYSTTRNGRLGLGTYYANSPDDPELRRELAENLYEEETGRISGVNKCHMDVFFDFLAAFGMSEDDARTLVSPFGEMPPQGRAIPPEDYYAELAAYGLSVETPNAEFCARIYKALRDNYGFTDDELTWFSMHAALDADHGDEFKLHAEKAALTPGGLEKMRELTLFISAAVCNVWNGFGLWKDVR